MPDFYLFGGPNGAGKTTLAMKLLPELDCRELVSVEELALGISPFQPKNVAGQAGTLAMEQLSFFLNQGVDFGFESTLSGTSYLPFLKRCREQGYCISLIYVWLNNSELAIQRIGQRKRSRWQGEFEASEEIIRGKYGRSRRNFLKEYMPLADRWAIYDNSQTMEVLVAEGGRERDSVIFETEIWRHIHGGNEAATE